MVVFPEPVGPETRKIPWGRRIISSNTLRSSSAKPRDSSPTICSLVRSLITTFSPCIVGKVDILMSRTAPWTRSLIRPSCGTLRSAMSIPAMIFMRVTIGRCICLGRMILSSRTPSTLLRIFTELANGSTCMSLARSRTAPLMIRLTSATTLAPEAISFKRSATSSDASTPYWTTSMSSPASSDTSRSR